jgi:hypothetical protein
MADEQPKLLNGPDKKSLGGPIFESGPGWGFYVKRWLGKYLFKIILPAIIVIAVVGVFTARKGTENKGMENNEKIAGGEKITVAIVRGDSRVLLARKALAEYLGKNPGESLSNGQKLFIEENLRRKIENPKLVIGEVVEFAVADVESAIAQAKRLTQSQLEAWERYAKEINF